MMNRHGKTVCALVTLGTCAVLSAAPKFTSIWKAPDARGVRFTGQKVAAVVISQDESLRVSGEEALVRELTARNMTGVAAYRIVPKEELQNADKARPWFERANVEGIVALRPVSADKRTTYTPGTWTNPYYGTLWGYYGYGWGNLYIPGSIQQDTVVVVETTIYSVRRNQLLWGAVSETKNPKTLAKFVEDLAKAVSSELKKEGLTK